MSPRELSPFVKAAIDVIELCQTADQLERVGQHLKHENLNECDLKILRDVYRECRDAIELLNGEPIE